MKAVYLILPCLIQAAYGEQWYSVEPREMNVVREGDKVTLECITTKEVSCSWLIELESTGGRVLFTNRLGLRDLPDIPRKTDDDNTNCTISIMNMSTKYNGIYSCSPSSDVGPSVSRAAHVFVAQKPTAVQFVGEQAGQHQLMVGADQPATVSCEARDARPKAELLWFIGDTEIHQGVSVADQADPVSKLVTSRSNLTRHFGKEDDGVLLRCEARHVGYDAEDQRDAELQVLVQYAPYRAEGSNLGTLYGFTTNQVGHVSINFTSNPAPTELLWSVGDGVMVSSGDTSEDGRFRAAEIEQVDSALHQYTAELSIDPVLPEDQEVAFQLRLSNGVGVSRLDFRLGAGAPPPPPAAAAVGGGVIAIIIIAVLLLLLAIALVAFARSRGKWCFAARPTEAGAEASDTESAHDEKSDKPDKKSFKLSNLYSSLVTKKKEADVEAAGNKDETAELTGPDREEPPKKDGEIVYAELVLDKDGLKTEVRPSPDTTEYAVIVGTKKEDEAQKKE